MANIDQAFGLRPIAKVGSAPGGTTGTTKYSIASGASGIFTGDPVTSKRRNSRCSNIKRRYKRSIYGMFLYRPKYIKA